MVAVFGGRSRASGVLETDSDIAKASYWSGVIGGISYL
jgi:hypothetical protein